MTSAERTTPSTAFLDHAAAGISARMAEVTEAASAAEPAALDAYPGQKEAWRVASISAEALEPTLTELLCDLHAHPELAFEEVHAQGTLTALLEETRVGDLLKDD